MVISTIDGAKQRADDAVRTLAPELIAISRAIHACPELKFEERAASALAMEFARAQGFDVQEHAGGLETAFRAEWGSGPVSIGVCVEYDALPEIGHACGHNLIAGVGLGAAAAMKAALGPKDARVVILGTPGEEGGGGKIIMLEAGCFEGIDAAMMAHPGPVDAIDGIVMGGVRVEVEYHGKAAHQGATPELGLNALDAIVTAYNGIAQLRQHIRRDARVAAIITHGGDAVNVVPAYTRGIFSARAASAAYLADLRARLTGCIEAGALATGCDVTMKWADREYAPLRANAPLNEAYKANAESLGRNFISLAGVPIGGTDMGNVSQALPSIHPEFGIGTRVFNHTPDFTGAAITDEAHDAMLQVAAALAMTGVEAALDRGLMERARADFKRGMH